MKVLIAKKLGMLRQFTETGAAVGVTAVEVLPAKVLQRRTADKDGYEAVQVGAGEAKRAGKAALGQSGGVPYQVITEFPLPDDDVKKGAVLGIDQVAAGDRLKVTSVSKGKGFQGTVKRHNFSRGPMSHGSHNKRPPGSIGGVDAARVFPGQKMPGRMGAETVTLKNVEVTDVHAKDNVILLKGSVPGPVGAIVKLRGEGNTAPTDEAEVPAENEKTEEKA